MDDEITPHAQPIPTVGDPAWFPPAEDDNESASQPQPEPSTLRSIFYGRDGLRAGWSALLYIAIFVLIGYTAGVILHHLRHTPPPARGAESGPWTILIGEGFSFTSVAFAAFVVSRIEKRRFAVYGLPSPLRRVSQFAIGLVWGFVLLSVLVGILWRTGLLVFGARLLSGADVLQWGAVWLLGFFLVGLFEEFLTRGFLQFTIARGLAGIARALGMADRNRRVLGFWLSALFFSFIFGFGHKNNPGESSIGLLSAGLIGLVFAFSLWRTGSLWWAIGFHAAWDWAQSFVYGVADSGMMVRHHLMASHPQGSPLMSGGLTGPEGSIYILGIIALTAIIIAITLPSELGSPSDPAYSPNLRTGRADLLPR